ncbi:small acid-soluble spore protein P [Paenibacillus profundus]|uniref:Small acid-soluble spore protein P n=1 Tax=Paenibacillus profundus TaxID=1173085 RepID=A0ABS8YNY3_9BACL|nr:MULTISPECIES: small acid-soluble spore protein P [Paenibacillus]MCE5172163.1 small acid-soluble spore protein P [Paenibacillus profundus]MCM3342246.1 small acid-soluble spore protein P [Paenibacillus sp. MER TA 81-3]
MSKSKSVPVPSAAKNQSNRHHAGNERGAMQEPLSGSKKVKNGNHVHHNNPEG